MGYTKFNSVSRKPLIIVTVVFIVLVVIVGSVTWKITRNAYEAQPQAAQIVVTEAPGGTSATTQQTTYSPEEIQAKPWLSLRMLRHVLPVHYDIIMYPDFYGTHGDFYGNETIELQVLKATRYFLIHIHSTYLNVTQTALFDNSTGQQINIARTFYYGPNEFFVIETTGPVDRAVKLVLGFQGSLTKAIMGIYKSTYYNTQTNEQRHIVSSKFEPTYARQAFPCFDEPNIKAEFTITLVHRQDYIALSNMPQDGNPTPYQGMPDMLATKFMRSVKMSTYLVCFIVCDFLSLETNSTRGIPVRVFATPDKISQAQYALEIAKHTLDYYEILFNMTYPLPKQDLIAIPDFVSGAMEHWGLITFRESYLLYDVNRTSLSSLETVALVVAHEMAHQWFGNIVTMDWWNDLWLNEGFASFMEYIGVADKENDWNMENIILVSDLFPVMKEDSELSSHPIIVEVTRPSEITSVFDSISYSKGSSIIRMLEHIMGTDNFFAGIAAYLKKFQWSNAVTDDLWTALSEYGTDKDIKHIMDTWTIQDGFPFVNITLVTSASGVTTVTAQQKRFMSNPDAIVNPSSSPLGYKWYIPLDYISSNGTEGRQIMDLTDIKLQHKGLTSSYSRSHYSDGNPTRTNARYPIQLYKTNYWGTLRLRTFSASLGLDQPGTWVKFNHEQQGFYRVLYPDAVWDHFSNYLLNTNPANWSLSVPDRAGLLSDVFSMAPAGLLSYEIPLGLMSYLTKEMEFIPWSAALDSGIYYITNMLKSDPEFGLWKKFVASRLQHNLQNLNFTDTGSHNQRKLLAKLLYAAGEVEEPQSVNKFGELFHSWLESNISISVNLRSTVYKYGMFYSGSDSDWETIWAKYRVESSPQEKELLALSLATTKQPYLIAKLLNHAKEEDGIKRQDFFTTVSNVGSNIAATGIVWDWARENYQAFINRFTVTDRNFGRMIYFMVRNYKTEFKLQEVKDFFSRYPEEGSSARYRKMALESIERNIYWMKTYKPIIIAWLKTHT